MESRTITVEGLRTRVLVEEGRGEVREPIVLIHGVGGWAENWRPVMADLASTGRQVLALDLPGFGESERPQRVRYFGPDEAFYPRFVIAAMDVLGIERGGETTSIGDTEEDEDRRRRELEDAAEDDQT